MLAMTGSTAEAAPTPVPVVTGLQTPSMFTIAPDGRIFYAETYTGRIGVFTPASGSNATYFQVPSMCGAADPGLFGVALDPNFTQTRTLYAYANRRTADGSCHNQVLKIGPTAGGGELTMDVLLSDPYVKGHVGGRLLFGADGNLYVSTGDGSSGLPRSRTRVPSAPRPRT